MTAIAGFVKDGEVWIGGDSAAVSGYYLTTRSAPKVFRNGDYLFGFTSSFRMGNAIQFIFKPPSPPGSDGELFGFMCTQFIDSLRSSMKECGVAKKENEVESCGSFLVGVKGRLFEIADDYQVGEPSEGYAACGCGRELVMGSIWTSLRCLPISSPHETIEVALKAAEAHCAGVRGPFTILHLEGSTVDCYPLRRSWPPIPGSVPKSGGGGK